MTEHEGTTHRNRVTVRDLLLTYPKVKRIDRLLQGLDLLAIG